VKLSAMLGYYLGSGAVFTAIFLTVLTAALFSIAALLLKKANLKQEIPFAPFILTGTLITMMLGV
jgi:prepilin signal peptidase PulO-like enzyme (type II secretory pathway)